ncbi:6-phosphogluconolactonase [Oceanicola granulosus HTCC2516]|uniref:6-phosphogluconolactonase n=1 Tax=Oceanicola granulosus (strain ATCC BAA-861 / DSM 15982 / KCTC 12143 / HTCC2516) TaxID=314256 RepID=Q2C9P7_OCEGH|nr:6-phosphogluconolactonase [Oceanicola granulosus]EAR49397.1 6-phosphogluconolactonase [Oceanicola granulosus HTCC2516]
MELKEYPDAEMMMMDIADLLASELRTCLVSHDHASLAVPGGTTPGPIFDSLCATRLDWDRVHVLLTDERWVPETSERSNTRLLRQRLLTDNAAAARLVPLYADAPAPEARLEELEEALRPELPLSVLLLGMGADMHTASIFPGADRLEEALHGDSLLVPMRAPGAPEPRVTLSAKVLRGAMSTHIVITGAEKRAALDEARKLPPEEAPVAAVLRDATVHWAEK